MVLRTELSPSQIQMLQSLAPGLRVTVDGENVFKEVTIVKWCCSVYSMSIQMVSLQEREPWDVNVHTFRKDHMNTEIRWLSQLKRKVSKETNSASTLILDIYIHKD